MVKVHIMPLLLLVALCIIGKFGAPCYFPYHPHMHLLAQRLGYNSKNNACTYPGLYLFIVWFDHHSKSLKKSIIPNFTHEGTETQGSQRTCPNSQLRIGRAVWNITALWIKIITRVNYYIPYTMEQETMRMFSTWTLECSSVMFGDVKYFFFHVLKMISV